MRRSYLVKVLTNCCTVSVLGGYLGRVRAAVRLPLYTVPTTKANTSHEAIKVRLELKLGSFCIRFCDRKVAMTIWTTTSKPILL